MDHGIFAKEQNELNQKSPTCRPNIFFFAEYFYKWNFLVAKVSHILSIDIQCTIIPLWKVSWSNRHTKKNDWTEKKEWWDNPVLRCLNVIYLTWIRCDRLTNNQIERKIRCNMMWKIETKIFQLIQTSDCLLSRKSVGLLQKHSNILA